MTKDERQSGPDGADGQPDASPVPDEGRRGDGLLTRRGLDQRVPSWLDAAVQYTWRGIVLIAGLAGVIFVMTRLYLVTLPVIVALILSTICVPPARRLQRRGVPRLAAASIVVVGGIGSFAGIIALLTPAFISQVQELRPTVLQAVDQVLTWLEEGPIGYDRAQVEELFRNAMDQFEGFAGTIATQVGSIALAVVEGITALVLAIVLLFFFIKDGEQIVDWFISRTPAAHRDTVRATGKRGWVALAGFVRGTALVALVDAVGIGIGLWIVGVPLVLPLAVLVFFGGFVPVLGAFVTGLLAVLVALADGGPSTALIVLAIVVAVQQIESNVLQPTIMRRAVALHPVVILGVLTAGAILIGIVGAFLAVPFAAVVAAVANELRLRHEAEQRGVVLTGRPIGGPDVDPSLVLPEFPPDAEFHMPHPRRRRRAAAADAEAMDRADADRADADRADADRAEATDASEAADASRDSGGPDQPAGTPHPGA